MIPNSHIEVTKMHLGKIISKTIATIDQNGFRASSAANQKSKTKHLFLVDSSFIFGDGLNDDETIAHQVNVRSKTFEAYPLAYGGYGPQHAWMYFQEKQLGQKIPFKKGRLIFFTHERDLVRLLGTTEVLAFDGNSPLLKEIKPGRFEHAGRFDQVGSFWQRLLIRFCAPQNFCRSLMLKNHQPPTDEQLAYAARVFEDVQRMYKEQFDVENFQIVWTGNEEIRERFKKLTSLKVLDFPIVVESSEDLHPTARGAKQVVDFLFDSKLVE